MVRVHHLSVMVTGMNFLNYILMNLKYISNKSTYRTKKIKNYVNDFFITFL